CQQHGRAREDQELLLAALAPHLAMRQQIDANVHGSNLRMASPVAISRAGASVRTCRSRTALESSIPWNGLIRSVATFVRAATASISPGTTAVPPASRI